MADALEELGRVKLADRLRGAATGAPTNKAWLSIRTQVDNTLADILQREAEHGSGGGLASRDPKRPKRRRVVKRWRVIAEDPRGKRFFIYGFGATAKIASRARPSPPWEIERIIDVVPDGEVVVLARARKKPPPRPKKPKAPREEAPLSAGPESAEDDFNRRFGADASQRRVPGRRRRPARDPKSIRPGDRIYHLSLGTGVVVAVRAEGSVAVIRFPDGSHVTVSARALRPLGKGNGSQGRRG